MKQFAVILLISVLCCFVDVIDAQDEYAPACPFIHYYQWDPQWRNDTLPCGDTIWGVGCALTSVAMCLGPPWNPGNLNQYLIDNNGYEGCSIIWAAVDPLTNWTFVNQKPYSEEDLGKEVQSCNNCFIANVRNETHWVLVNGYNGNGNFTVLDPAYNQTTYSYSDMFTESYYNIE
eukprot:TRINITY_DN19227_c0_g1_i1.p1 TRINITY_DN19227_c0_g1~~TRINITY_DN19227_c0_g1_i1.p1  ORF type:complete len:175 (+),score=18.19 TRINITY_DN19227_c0_g1_i1:47-571(+)